MTVELDCAFLTSRRDAHDYLAGQLNLPDYYGRNLDALYDLLTEKGSGMTLVLEHSDAMREALGSYGSRLIAALLDAEQATPDLHVTIL